MSEKISVLYLDDEEQNLISFKASFRREFEVFTTQSASEAVQYLNENTVHVVISDQKMPDISGVEFFELIIQDFPGPVRILLTGYADIEAVIDAINKGEVFRYISKPWDDQDLRMTINNAYEVYNNRRRIKEQKIKLEKAYAELEKFVYSASHDMRAPLVSVLGVIELAKKQNDSTNAEMEYLPLIEESILKLDEFVQNMIHYYQNIQNSSLSLKINLDEIIEDVFKSHRHLDYASKVELMKSVDAGIDFKGDPMRLRLLLNNLVSNAIKFHDPLKSPSYVRITVSEDENTLHLRVEDNGVGIEQDYLPFIYDMFYKATEHKYGSGIGLFIAKEAVQKMNGSIEVSSEKGKGTTFIIDLPKNG